MPQKTITSKTKQMWFEKKGKNSPECAYCGKDYSHNINYYRRKMKSVANKGKMCPKCFDKYKQEVSMEEAK